MITINLLPNETKLNIKKAKQSANVFSVCLVVLVICAFLGFIIWGVRSYLLEPQLDATKNEQKNLVNRNNNYEELENKALFLNDRANLVKAIESQKAIWSQVIQDLINSVPTEVQFASLSADLTKAPNITLQGNTVSEREIIKFKEKLEASKFFKDVAFKSSTASEEEGKLTFSLEFNIEDKSVQKEEKKMNRLSWIFVGITSLIVLALGFFVYRPMITGGLKTYRENQDYQKQNSEFEQKSKSLVELDKNNQLQTLYSTASQYIPDNADSGPLILEVSAIAKESNMSVGQLSLESSTQARNATSDSGENAQTASTAAPSGALSEIGFSLTVSGTFADYMNFLKKVETSSRLITLKSMNLSKSEDKFTANLKGTAYWKKDSTLEKSVANITLGNDVIDMFKNLKTYSVPINLPSESGFGRQDPFETY